MYENCVDVWKCGRVDDFLSPALKRAQRAFILEPMEVVILRRAVPGLSQPVGF